MGHAGGYEDYAFIADLYDFVVPYRGRPDVAFFVEAAQESGGPVLEVGCGTGRVLIPKARAGVEITGLDLSEHMLAVCRWWRAICAILTWGGRLPWPRSLSGRSSI